MQRLCRCRKRHAKGQHRCNLDYNRNKYYDVRDMQLYSIGFSLELDSRVTRQAVNPRVDGKVLF